MWECITFSAHTKAMWMFHTFSVFIVQYVIATFEMKIEQIEQCKFKWKINQLFGLVILAYNVSTRRINAIIRKYRPYVSLVIFYAKKCQSVGWFIVQFEMLKFSCFFLLTIINYELHFVEVRMSKYDVLTKIWIHQWCTMYIQCISIQITIIQTFNRKHR